MFRESNRRPVSAATVALPLLTWCLAAAAAGLEFPLLEKREYQYLAGEISGDASYEHIRFMTQFHRPRGGAPGLMKVAEYFEAKAREYGLENVRLIRQKGGSVPWHARSASLWMIQPEVRMLADLQQTPIRLADHSRSADVRAEVIDVGAGLIESDYSGKDVKNKVVLAHGSAGAVVEQAVWKRGASGIIYFPDPDGLEYPLNSLDHPDQIKWVSLPRSDGSDRSPTFAFVLTEREGRSLRSLIATSSSRVQVHARVDAEYGGEPWQVMVEAFVRGSEIHDQDVVLTGHLQEEKYSANDDASGSANTLEIARAVARLVRERSIPRPRRNLRFWWVTEIGSERQFFADHPAEAGKLLVNINQDMVGANQGQDVLRVQNITRVPFSRSHFLTAVAERVVRHLVETNTPQLASLQAGETRMPGPIFSALGTRHRYNAAVIPFHNSTDHMTFNEAPIGVPGITFTNWPDNFIHSSDDDLWNIDRTQLQRNALAAAMIALVAARASDETIPALATEVYNSARSHLAVDAAVAADLVRNARGEGLAASFRSARSQIRQGILREKRALETVAAAGSKDGTGARLCADLKGSLERLEELLAAELDTLCRSLHGACPDPAPLSDTERRLAGMTPRLAAGPAEFLKQREKIGGVDGLHDLMAFEILNFVDGRRSGLEIYEAVGAEARHAGAHYYGEVSAEKVDQHLKNLENAGLVRH